MHAVCGSGKHLSCGWYNWDKTIVSFLCRGRPTGWIRRKKQAFVGEIESLDLLKSSGELCYNKSCQGHYRKQNKLRLNFAMKFASKVEP